MLWCPLSREECKYKKCAWYRVVVKNGKTVFEGCALSLIAVRMGEMTDALKGIYVNFPDREVFESIDVRLEQVVSKLEDIGSEIKSIERDIRRHENDVEKITDRLSRKFTEIRKMLEKLVKAIENK